ncbi:MAG: two-component system sensor histidine kinase PhoQ [Yoonia sp.]|jgi:two-component system sensor histidine kinase PhoQ
MISGANSNKLNRPNNPFNSLRTRIMVSALLIIVVVLPSIGIALNNAFERQVRANVKEQLNAYFYSILAVTEIENGELQMPEALLENQFNVINSGLYAFISSDNSLVPLTDSEQLPIVWFSNSFLGASISQDLPSPKLGNSRFAQIQLNGESHFIYSFTVAFETSGTAANTNNKSAPITLHIVKDLAGVIEQQKAFSQQLWTLLLVLIVVLLLIQAFWLAWTLKPLARFTQELNAVQVGELEQLSQQYPKELNAVAKQLNALLRTQQQQRQRYRNALADLAHSLKTPLAVMQSQKDLNDASMEQISQINRIIGHQLKRAQSGNSSAWHLGIKVALVSDKLLRTLAKIYPTIDLSYMRKPKPNITFRGDEADLTEMLGNLLDNACKAAKSTVTLSIYEQDKRLSIVVEDDGEGISNSQKLIVLERGKRADTYKQGHGIGLAIVRDLVDNYQGSLHIDSSIELGGAKFTLGFAQP